MAAHHRTWENYHKFAIERASLAADILQRFTPLGGKAALDFGCGRGTLARLLARCGAMVTAVDIDPDLKQFFEGTDIQFYIANRDEWQHRSYDLIVLQDVLEHVPDPDSLFGQLNEVLSRGGLLYISTPNRFSPVNFLADPHWSLPGVAFLPRSLVAFFVQKVFRQDSRQRTDWPALFSLGKLKKLFSQHGLEMMFVNRLVAQKLFQRPVSVVCHPVHLRIVYWLKQHHLERWIIPLVNDHHGLFNWLINPTWYIVGRKG